METKQNKNLHDIRILSDLVDYINSDPDYPSYDVEKICKEHGWALPGKKEDDSIVCFDTDGSYIELNDGNAMINYNSVENDLLHYDIVHEIYGAYKHDFVVYYEIGNERRCEYTYNSPSKAKGRYIEELMGCPRYNECALCLSIRYFDANNQQIFEMGVVSHWVKNPFTE
jgi:hypothetical protein